MLALVEFANQALHIKLIRELLYYWHYPAATVMFILLFMFIILFKEPWNLETKQERGSRNAYLGYMRYFHS